MIYHQKIVCVLLCLLTLMTAGCSRHKHFEIKKAKVNGTEIAYYTRGNGKPLVMIMGFRGAMGIWDPALLEALEKHYTLILFDNRGVGLSSDTEQDLTTIPQMAKDTVGLINSLGYEKANVLGWSMGSMIAMQIAVDHPEIVDNLILCSPSPGKRDVPRVGNAFKELTSLEVSKEKALSLLFPNTPTGEKAKALYVANLTASIVKKTAPEDLNISTQTVERQVRAVKQWTESSAVYDALPNIKLPTLVTGGLDDILDQRGNTEIIAKRIPFCWTAFFPNAGHAFLFQDAKQFSQLVTLFIEAHQKGE